jgi:hypothetical protein
VERVIITIEDIANHLMTAGIQGQFAKQMWAQWEYRKGKTIEDLKEARRKAAKAGMHKLEFEINMARAYVKDVLKKRRKADKWTLVDDQLFCRSCGLNQQLNVHARDCVYVIRGDSP